MPAAAPPFAARLRRSLAALLPEARAWWLIAGACVLGVLLFAGVWLSRSSSDADAEVDAMPATADGARLPALPAPQPADARAGGFDHAGPQASQAPVRIDAHVPQAAPPPPVPAPVADTAPSSVAAADLPDHLPRPVTTPQPDYPRASLRRGEQGEVLLLVKVDAAGRVDDVEILSSSQHRRLDRAAVSAVRRWRFEPAVRGGQAVAGELRVPISFAPGG